MKCPKCGKNKKIPNKSWQYGIFKVDTYSCDCGTQFRVYKSLFLDWDENTSGKHKIEEHKFILQLENGRWKKKLVNL
jgi:hypothetical protein